MDDGNKETAETSEDVILQLEEVWKSYAAELSAKVGRLDQLIGRSHWLSVGNYKESLLRALLRDVVPRKFHIGTGFLLGALKSQEGPRKKLSRQIDLLTWNEAEHTPIFRTDDFVIVPPEACRSAIEVKGHLTHADLKSAIKNLDTIATFGDLLGHHNSPFTALFAYSSDEDVTFPDSYFNALYKHYKLEKTFEIERRVSYSQHYADSWTRPWINEIVVMNKGVIVLTEWSVNGADYPVYLALKTTAGQQSDLSYAFMARNLSVSLRVGDARHRYRYEAPGAASLQPVQDLEPYSDKCFMLLPDPHMEIKQLGRSQLFFEVWAKAQYFPRGFKHEEESGEQ